MILYQDLWDFCRTVELWKIMSNAKLREAIVQKIPEFYEIFHKQGGSTGFHISYSEIVILPKFVENLNKDFINAVRGGGVTILWKYFIKFRYFLKDGFPKGSFRLLRGRLNPIYIYQFFPCDKRGEGCHSFCSRRAKAHYSNCPLPSTGGLHCLSSHNKKRFKTSSLRFVLIRKNHDFL